MAKISTTPATGCSSFGGALAFVEVRIESIPAGRLF